MRRTALCLALSFACQGAEATDDDTGTGASTSTSATSPDDGADAASTADDTNGITGVDDGDDDDDGSSDDGSPMPGGPGCGFDSAAFCDTFDAPATLRGRAGDLDVRRWSAARGNPQLPTGNGNALAAGPATIGPCRADLPTQVFPDQDTLVCDPNDAIASNHLLVAVGAQNYGQISYRIRQPFDFADRTGTIAFDAEGWMLSGLLGWISVEITEDAAPLPSFSIGGEGQMNDEGGAVPRNALEIQFQSGCAGQPGTVAVRFVDVITEYVDELFMPQDGACVTGAQGKLNHFEITVSQTRVEVWATPFSEDGIEFDAPVLLYGVDVSLPFSRGWVHLTTHNHATIKYSHDDTYGATAMMDAWITRWDNVGFDGPVVATTREVEVGDSLVEGTNAWNIAGPVMNVGYLVPDTVDAAPVSFTLPGVELDGVASAQLAIAMWYLLSEPSLPPSGFALRFRLNGNEWHERTLTPAELAMLGNGHAQGAIGQVIDVPLADLVVGDNTLELETRGVPQSYPPVASAIDLVLSQ
jgi:hypothetical protein